MIAGALGLETSSGEFEVIDLCFAEMPPQHEGEGIEQDEMDIDGVDKRPFIFSWINFRMLQKNFQRYHSRRRILSHLCLVWT